MRVSPLWSRSYVAHSARVALVATVIIGAMYVCVVAGFNVIDRHRLVGQIDARLDQRLAQAARQPADAGSIDNYANAHDVDDAPVFLWSVTGNGRSAALTPGAPVLSPSDWSSSNQSVDARLGGELPSPGRPWGERLVRGGTELGQRGPRRIRLDRLEAIAGPLLLLAVFLGTLLIGIKAARPVELARLRQLEFTADASHELRTPLSVIEAEVTLSLNGPSSGPDYRDTLARVGEESVRLRDIVEDLLWLARFDSEPPPPGNEPVDVAAIASSCAERFSAVAQRGGSLLCRCEIREGSPLDQRPARMDRPPDRRPRGQRLSIRRDRVEQC